MTRFVDVPAMAKLIQAIEVDEFIADLVAAVKKAANTLPNNGVGSAPLPYGSV